MKESSSEQRTACGEAIPEELENEWVLMLPGNEVTAMV